MVGQNQASKATKGDKKDKNDKEDKDDGGRTQFGRKDWELLLNWLQSDNNLEAVTGSEGKTKIGAKFLNKKQAYQDLASFINKHQYKGSTLKPLSWEMARNRYNYLCTLHKKAKQASDSTGFGLTDKDVAKGIRTVEEKLDKICPCYDQVNQLFGGTPRTELKLNNLVSDLGGSSDEQLPWTQIDNEAEDGEAIELSDDENQDQVDGEAATTFPHSVAMEDEQTDATIRENGENLSPATPIATTQTPLPTPQCPLPTPTSQGLQSPAHTTPEPCETSAFGATSRPTKSVPIKSKSNRLGSYPNKKPSKGQSLSSAFSSGMEAISMEKIKANEIKERAWELRFANLQADRALRADHNTRKLNIEEYRCKIDEQQMAHEAQNSVMEARLKLVNENKHRKPEEVIAILAAFSAGLP